MNEIELRKFSPYARLEIASEKKGHEYIKYLEDLLEQAFGELHPRNRMKIYYYDGEFSRYNKAKWKGLLFKADEYAPVAKTAEIFSVANDFAIHLRRQQIPLIFLVRHRSDWVNVNFDLFVPASWFT